MSTETFKKLPLHEAIVLLKNGQSLADISRRAGQNEAWLGGILYTIRRNGRIAKTTLKKLYEAMPALQAVAEPYAQVGKRYDLAAARRNMAKARAAAAKNRELKKSKEPVVSGEWSKVAGSLAQKLHEIEGKYGRETAAAVASILSSWGMK